MLRIFSFTALFLFLYSAIAQTNAPLQKWVKKGSVPLNRRFDQKYMIKRD
jgi:hypothetical protein